MLKELQSQGIVTEYPPCDIGDLKSLHDALEVSVTTMPPIKGCFIASIVLRVRPAYSTIQPISNKMSGLYLRHDDPG